MILTTPSGYEVHIKDFLSFGEKRQLEKFIASKVMVKADSKRQVEVEPVSGSLNYEMQDMAFGFLIQKIIKVEEEITTKLYDEVMTWKEEDGQAVFDAINEVTSKSPLVPSKKS
jgi:hypothetical protein